MLKPLHGVLPKDFLVMCLENLKFTAIHSQWFFLFSTKQTIPSMLFSCEYLNFRYSYVSIATSRLDIHPVTRNENVRFLWAKLEYN